MGSIPVGSTKKQTQTCLLLLSLRRIERLLTQPDSRTLGVLADTREYQNDRGSQGVALFCYVSFVIIIVFF